MPGDASRLFIVERGGAIRVLNLLSGVLETTPFLTIPNVDTTGEGGLLGMAFHPDYDTNGKFYVNVTFGNPFSTHVREYTVNIDGLLTPDEGSPMFPVSFGEDETGNLYIAYLVSGDVYRIQTTVAPAPLLDIRRDADTNVVLSWGTNFTGFTLETSTHLMTGVWSEASPAPAVLGTNLVVTNTVSGSARFYRLRR